MAAAKTFLLVFLLSLTLVCLIRANTNSSTSDASTAESRPRIIKIKRIKIETTTEPIRETISETALVQETTTPVPAIKKRRKKVKVPVAYRSKTVYRIKAKKAIPNGHSYEKVEDDGKANDAVLLKRQPSVLPYDEKAPVNFRHLHSGYKDTSGPGPVVDRPPPVEYGSKLSPVTAHTVYVKHPSLGNRRKLKTSPKRLRKPINQHPIYTQPVEDKPIYNQPVEDKPIYNQPIYKQPVEEKPIYNQPIYKQPVEEKPIYHHPVEDKPIYHHPVEDKPIYHHPVEDKPIYHHPVEDKLLYHHPVEDKPIYHHPVEDKPIYHHPVEDKPISKKPRKIKQVPEQTKSRLQDGRVSGIVENEQSKNIRDEEVSKKVKEEYEKDKPFFPKTYYPGLDYFSKDDVEKQVPEHESKKRNKAPTGGYGNGETTGKDSNGDRKTYPVKYEKGKSKGEENDLETVPDVPPIAPLKKGRGRGPRYLPEPPPPPQARPVYRIERPPQAYYSPPEPHYYSAPRSRKHYPHDEPLTTKEQVVPSVRTKGYLSLPPQHKPYIQPAPPPPKHYKPPPLPSKHYQAPHSPKHYYHEEPEPKVLIPLIPVPMSKPYMRDPSSDFESDSEPRHSGPYRLPSLHYRPNVESGHRPFRKPYYHGADGPVYTAPGYGRTDAGEERREKKRGEEEEDNSSYHGQLPKDEFERDFQRVRGTEDENKVKVAELPYEPGRPAKLIRKPDIEHSHDPSPLRPKEKTPVYYSMPRIVYRPKPVHKEPHYDPPPPPSRTPVKYEEIRGYEPPEHRRVIISHRPIDPEPRYVPPPPPPAPPRRHRPSAHYQATRGFEPPPDLDPRALGFSSSFMNFINKLQHFERLYI